MWRQRQITRSVNLEKERLLNREGAAQDLFRGWTHLREGKTERRSAWMFLHWPHHWGTPVWEGEGQWEYVGTRPRRGLGFLVISGGQGLLCVQGEWLGGSPPTPLRTEAALQNAKSIREWALRGGKSLGFGIRKTWIWFPAQTLLGLVTFGESACSPLSLPVKRG